MWKWILGVVSIILLVAVVVWLNIDKNVRYLIVNPPESANVLFWTTKQRDAGFQAIEQINVVPYKMIDKGDIPSSLVIGKPLAIQQAAMDAYFKEQRAAGLVVLHNGELVYENYGLGFGASGKWTSFSVAKSFTSTLVGAAIKDGYIESLQDKVSKYIPDMQGSEYDNVSVEQLLTMTSGIKWNEDYADPNSDVSKFNFHTPDPGVDSTVSYMRRLTRAHPPGTKWLYSTGETNLIGLLVSEATGQSISDYLSEKVWSKIGMEQDASWVLGPTGHEISGCCIQASTRDFALFGQFILQGAQINGESIVPSGWFEKATTKQADIGRPGSGYGYQWWTNDDGSFQGRGIYGQGIFIDPERNLVIALNSNWLVASGSEPAAARSKMYNDIRALVGNSRF